MTSRWGERWLALVDDGAPQTVRRLNRGSTLLRSGRVSDVRIRPGIATARVQGTTATPLGIEISVPAMSDDEWDRVAAVLAAQVRHRARLLAGQVPDSLEAELESAGVHLFPSRADIATDCRCDDRADVCDHVAAVWLAVGRLVEDDPFVWLRLRGRGRERLLAQVATLHGADAAAGDTGVEPASLADRPWVAAGTDLDDLEVGPAETPRTSAGPLRMLGDPPGWAGGVGAGELFAPLVERGAAWAAVAAEDAGADDADADGPAS